MQSVFRIGGGIPTVKGSGDVHLIALPWGFLLQDKPNLDLGLKTVAKEKKQEEDCIGEFLHRLRQDWDFGYR
jgi:hypothetical protein